MNKDYWIKYYEEHSMPFEPSSFSRFVLKYLEPNDSILDLGCGNGRDSVFFASQSIKTIAIDQCENIINKIESLKISNLECFVSDFEQLSPKFITSHAYARFTMHSITEDVEDKLLNWVKANISGYFFIEARSDVDTLEKIDHYRRFLNFESTLIKLINLGFKIHYAELSRGFSKIENDDPMLIRIVSNKDHSVKAIFAPNIYTLSTHVNGNGTITPDSTTINHGAETTICVSADTGFHIDQIFIDDEVVFSKRKKIPNIFVWMGNNYFETLYVSLQMLLYKNLAEHIYVYLPQWDGEGIAEHKRRESISKLKTVTIVDFLVDSNRKTKGAGGLEACLENFFENHLEEDSMILLAQDHWILETDHLMRFWDKFLDEQAEIMNYWSKKSGNQWAAWDLMFISSNGIKRLLLEQNIWSLIKTGNGNPVNFDNQLDISINKRSVLKQISFNSHENPINMYGYSPTLGRVHLHFGSEKEHYVKLWQKHHRAKLDVDLVALKEEDDRLCVKSTQHQPLPLAKDLEDSITETI